MKADTLVETPLGVLNRGLLLLNIKQEMEESAYTAMDRITKNRKVVSRRQEYGSDIERVIQEAKLTTQLMKNIDEEIKSGDKVFNPEELINYYNGIFLDQVHQIRDKLFRMINFLLLDLETAQDNQKRDLSKLRYAKIVEDNEQELKEAGIHDLLSEWYTPGTNIVVAIDKRTQHHHLVSTLKLNSDYQNIQMSRMMLSPVSITYLSGYGKKRMKEIGDDSFKKWRDDIIDKQQKTIDQIEGNINQIATKLVAHFAIPAKPEEYAPIVASYQDFLSSFDIHNKAEKSKVDPVFMEMIEGSVEIARQSFGDTLLSVYLVGSCGRGEFIPGSSDLNLYFIFGNEAETHKSVDKYPLLNATFLTEKIFLSDAGKKDRFICWSDGIHIFGKKYDFDKKDFPKPGTLLTLLLNRNTITTLEALRDEVSALDTPTPRTMRRYSLKAVKMMLDFDFGVAMANKPLYTASRSEKIKYIKKSWPNERRVTTFEQIYKSGSIRQEDFSMMIDTFLKNAKSNMEKMLEIEKEIKRDE